MFFQELCSVNNMPKPYFIKRLLPTASCPIKKQELFYWHGFLTHSNPFYVRWLEYITHRWGYLSNSILLLYYPWCTVSITGDLTWLSSLNHVTAALVISPTTTLVDTNHHNTKHSDKHSYTETYYWRFHVNNTLIYQVLC